MGTSWEEIEVRAMTYIKNDESLKFDMQYRLPVFYNRMAAYMQEAIPLFNRPFKMLEILGQYIAPEFDDAYYTVDTSESGINISAAAGYDICSVGTLTEDEWGKTIYTPISNISYDSSTGLITSGTTLDVGTDLIVELYKSGSFMSELDVSAKGILAFCIYNVYEHRFDNDVLERTSKIRDSSFTTISEASQTNANTARQRHVDEELYGMLRTYEVNCELVSRDRRGGLWQS